MVLPRPFGAALLLPLIACASGLPTSSRGTAELEQGAFRYVELERAGEVRDEVMAAAASAIQGRDYVLHDTIRPPDLVIIVAQGPDEGIQLIARSAQAGREVWRGEIERARTAPIPEVQAALRRLVVDLPRAPPRPVAY